MALKELALFRNTIGVLYIAYESKCCMMTVLLFGITWDPRRSDHTSKTVCSKPPCIADADILFYHCGYYLSFFPSTNLSRGRLDVYHT